MKLKRKAKTAGVTAPALLHAPAVLALDGMVSTLEGLLGNFPRPIAVQVKRLIKLTTALREEASSERTGTAAARRRKR